MRTRAIRLLAAPGGETISSWPSLSDPHAVHRFHRSGLLGGVRMRVAGRRSSVLIRARPRAVPRSMRRTASSTSGWVCAARLLGAELDQAARVHGGVMYFLSCHFLPVSPTLSALITTTKSAAVACGVKIGFVLSAQDAGDGGRGAPQQPCPSRSMTTIVRWTALSLLPITVSSSKGIREQKPQAAKLAEGRR